MSKYHMNPETGKTGLCKAHKRPCPLGGDEVHFESEAEAREAYEKTQQGPPASMSKGYSPSPLSEGFYYYVVDHGKSRQVVAHPGPAEAVAEDWEGVAQKASVSEVREVLADNFHESFVMSNSYKDTPKSHKAVLSTLAEAYAFDNMAQRTRDYHTDSTSEEKWRALVQEGHIRKGSEESARHALLLTVGKYEGGWRSTVGTYDEDRNLAIVKDLEKKGFLALPEGE